MCIWRVSAFENLNSQSYREIVYKHDMKERLDFLRITV